jgi:hypothetical protein
MRMGWSRQEVAELVNDWISSQTRKGIQNEKETSEVFSYMNTLATYIRRKKDINFTFEINEIRKNPKTKNKEIVIESTGRDLLNAFKMISKDIGDRNTFSSTQQLMARLRSDVDILEDNNWSVSLSTRKISGDNVHRFVFEYVELRVEDLDEWAEGDE